MKALHRPDLYCWSVFDEARDMDFNGFAWIRPEGNILIDPVTMSTHDLAHLFDLGGAAWILVTNVDHVRATAPLARITGARVAAPAGEREGFPVEVHRWLADGEEMVPGLRVLEMRGSKSPAELALLLEETTLITGDLVRAGRAGRLETLPPTRLKDSRAALASVKRLAALGGVQAVLLGDGWSVFRDGAALLQELVTDLEARLSEPASGT